MNLAGALDALDARMQTTATAALSAVGEALAAAMQARAPRVTGTLQTSITWEVTGETSGVIRMKGYGRLVAFATPTLSMAPRNVRQRARYAALVGRAVVHPNDFVTAAWRSDDVQAVIARYPRYQFTLTP